MLFVLMFVCFFLSFKTIFMKKLVATTPLRPSRFILGETETNQDFFPTQYICSSDGCRILVKRDCYTSEILSHLSQATVTVPVYFDDCILLHHLNARRTSPSNSHAVHVGRGCPVTMVSIQ